MSAIDTRSHLPIVLNGKHYEIDLASFRRTTVEAMRLQNDLNSEATEQTLNTVYVWKRSGADFRLGAGQYWFDVYDGSSRRRFHESLNVNPFNEHELSLLNTTTTKVAAPANAYKGSWLFTIQDNLMFVRNTSAGGVNSGWQMYNVPDPTVGAWTVGTTMTRVGGSGDTISFIDGSTEGTAAAGWLTSFGSNGLAGYFTSSNSTGREWGVWKIFLDTTFKFARLGATNKNYSDVLVAGNYVLAKYYDTAADQLVSISKSSHLLIADYEQGAMPHFTSAVLGPDGVYLSATDPINSSSSTNGLSSSIYRCSFNEAAAKLNPPAPIASLPLGEVINTMYSYAGYLLIGTSKGVRLGTFLQTGGVSFGPVIKLENYLQQIAGTTTTGTFNATDSSFHGGVTAFEPKGQYVWFNWNRYLTTDGLDYCGLGRIDLGQLVDDLQPAYATDLMVTNTLGAASEVQSIVNYNDKLYFTTASAGVFGESSTRQTSGWLRTGKINFGTTEPKQFVRVDAEGQNYSTGGTDIAVKFVGDASNLGSLAVNGTTVAVDGVTDEYKELQFTWSGSSNSANAKLNKWTLRAVPVPERQEEIYLPIIIRDSVTHNYALSVGMDPYTDFAELNALMKARSIIELKLGDEIKNVFIDSITTGEQQGVDVQQWNRDESWLEGVWHVKCITVDKTVSNLTPVIYQSPLLTIGSVTNLSAGSSATVTTTGSSSNPTLNFGIPVGTAGTNGTNGTNGANGVDGKTIRNGTTTPSSSLGVDGDFYLNTSAKTISGPKASGAWPAAVSIVGPKGDTGDTGAQGDWLTPQDIRNWAIRTYLNASDIGTLILLDSSDAVVIDNTIGASTEPGQRIDFIVTTTTTPPVFSASGTQSINGTPTLKPRTRYSAVTAMCISYNTWILVGDLAAS